MKMNVVAILPFVAGGMLLLKMSTATNPLLRRNRWGFKALMEIFATSLSTT